MKIFVTGGSGFIGRHVINSALKRGHRVIALARPSGGGIQPRPGLEVAHFEMEHVPEEVLRGCDAMIHLAAHGVTHGDNDWPQHFRVNVEYSMRLWFQALKAGIRRFIIGGSCFEYGKSGERFQFIPPSAPLEPTGPYAASKAAASMAAIGFAIQNRVELAILRPSHVFGDGEGPEKLWPSLKKAALAGVDLALTPGEQVRDFIQVENVAPIFVEAAEQWHIAEGLPVISNIGSGTARSLREFAEHWWKTFGGSGKLRFGEKSYRDGEVMRYVPLVNTLHVVA